MNQKKNLSILFFTLIVIMFGFGMVIPVMPFLVKSFGASGSAMGTLMASYALMQFLFAPFWGSLSDRFGRKPILMIGVLGNAIAQLLFGLSTELWMLFVARILAGILSSATMPTAMAYISDSTTHKERGGGMGLLGAAMGIGMVIGPGLAGWLATRSLSTPFFLAAFLSTIALILVWLILPESYPASARSQADHKLRGPQVKEMAQSLIGPIGFLFVMAFMLNFGLTNFESVFGLYASDRFNYGTKEVGILLTVIGILSAAIQGALTGPITRRWGESRVIKFALLGSAIGFPLMLLAESYWTILLTLSFFVISNSMLSPSVSSLISKKAVGGQGSTMGLTNAFMSLGRATGPVIAGLLFDVDLHLPYLFGGAVMAGGFLFSLVKLKPELQELSEPLHQPEKAL